MPPDKPKDHSLPSADQLAEQSGWLASARSRLFRRIQIARRRCVLDLGCGWRAVTPELVRRCSGEVVAADFNPEVLRVGSGHSEHVRAVCCDASRLPFRSECFDLVFCQFSLLWFGTEDAVREIRRVLCPGGVLVAIEPDYGGLIEYPPEIATAELWQTALRRAGAEPNIGRRLPGLLAESGFKVRVDLLDQLTPPSPLRFDLLRGLPLTDAESQQLDEIVAADAQCADVNKVVHLPVFSVTAFAGL